MNKPKYKLGDMIRDIISGDVEIIISIRRSWDTYEYKTQYDDPRPNMFRNERFGMWHEFTIDKFYTVIGNLFDKEKPHA